MMTKAKDLRDNSIEELEASYSDIRKELFDLKNSRERDKKLEKPHLLRAKRREIARLLTIINEKESASQQQATRGSRG
jgi:large subunit ribosomal protein L29